MADAATKTVIPADYPELALLAWNRDPARPIPAADALSLYERNWRHVDPARMSAAERALLDRLVREHGNGVFLGR